MGEVKRYTADWPAGVMQEYDGGDFVRLCDYARLEREHAAAQAELARLRAVEAAAIAVIDYPELDEDFAELLDALAEACGRKG